MLPIHDDFGRLRRTYEAIVIAAASALLLGHIVLLVPSPAVWTLWSLPAMIAGILLADFLSGLVHWFADTWGHETMRFLGRRLLRPFRVHHVNPDDFLRRRFLDVNGDVAMILLPVLVAAFFIPMDATGSALLRVLVVSLCAAGLPTNQVHQWAHMRPPPRPVRLLQRAGVLLRCEDHMVHHDYPHTANYCIATGWLNRPLTQLNFFRRLEGVVTRLTGLLPREDEQAFEKQVLAVGARHTAGDEHSP